MSCDEELTELERTIIRACIVRGDVSKFPRDVVDRLVARLLLTWNAPAFVPKRTASATATGIKLAGET